MWSCMAYATIRIKPETREKLAKLKGRETYDELLNKLLRLVPSGDDEGEYTDEFRMSLLNAKLDLIDGRVVTIEKAADALKTK